jgi:DNA-binding NarL/FixJ family response regulator
MGRIGRVLICDDRQHARESLTRAMTAATGPLQIECATNGIELVTRYTHRPAGLVMIGIRAEPLDSTPVTPRLHPRPRPHPPRRHRAEMNVRLLLDAFPHAAAVVYGSPDCAPIAVAAITAGARGFWRWDGSHHTALSSAIRSLARQQPSTTDHATSTVSTVTERELQVLRGMTRGMSNSQIGRELHLSEDTVKTHARRLFHKLGVNDRAHAVAHGLRAGLVS